MNRNIIASLEDKSAVTIPKQDIACPISDFYESASSDENRHFVKDTIPPPLSVSLEHMVNPTPVLLGQFPVPTAANFGSTSLPAAGRRTRSGWNSTEVEMFVERLSVTMQDLAVEGHCVHLIQNENCDFTAELQDDKLKSERPGSVGGAGRISSGAASSLSVEDAGELAAASSTRAIRDLALQLRSSTRAISRPTTLSPSGSSYSTPSRGSNSRYPKNTTSPWEKQEGRMSLRVRSSHEEAVSTPHHVLPSTACDTVEASCRMSSSSASANTAVAGPPDADLLDIKGGFPSTEGNLTSQIVPEVCPPPEMNTSGKAKNRRRGRPVRANAPEEPPGVQRKIWDIHDASEREITSESSLSLLLSSPSHITAERMWRSASQVALDAQPFIDVEMEKLMEFFHQLGDTTGTCITNNNLIKQENEVNYFSVCRGLLAATCLAHPARYPITWSPHTLPTIDQIVHDFSLLTRMISSHATAYALFKGKTTTAESNMSDSSSEYQEKKIPSSFVGSRDNQAPHKYMVHLLELLRAYLNTVMHLILCPDIRLMSDTNIQRIEDIVYRILFVVPRSFDKTLYRLYSSYITEIALQVYGAVWNHLEDDRHRLREEFFVRLPIDSDCLMERNCGVSSADEKVMPLTLGILSAIQSCPSFSTTAPVPTDVELGGKPCVAYSSPSWLTDQCSQWVDTLMQELVFKSASGVTSSKLESGSHAPLVSQLFEDVAGLVGAIEWPAADLFCRQCILSLSRLFMATSERKPTVTQTGTNLLPFAVDSVAKFLKVFLSAPYAILQSQKSIDHSRDMYLRNRSIEVLERSIPQGCTLPTTWYNTMMRKTSESSPDKKNEMAVVSGSLNDETAERSESVDVSMTSPCTSSVIRELESVVYLSLRSLSAPTNGSLREKSLSSVHTKSCMTSQILAAHISFWLWLDESPNKGSSSLSVRETKDLLFTEESMESVSNMDISPRQLREMNVLVSAQNERGVLHESVRRLLVSLLISVLQPRHDVTGGYSDKNVSDASSIGSVRKALTHLADVVELSPDLVEVVWPMLRKHLQYGSARLRESGVPLLSTLLSVSLSTCTSETCSRLEVATNVLSILLHLLDDDSIHVTTRTIAVLEGLLTDLGLSSILRKFGENHISFIQTKLLHCLELRTDKKTVDDIVRVFTKRWMYTLAVEEDTVHTTAQTTLVRELLALVELHAGGFPFEVNEKHPVLRLLQRMWSISGAGMVTDAGCSSPVREKRKSSFVDASTMKHTLRTLAHSLLSRYQAPVSRDDAVLCLATIHLLSMVSPEVVNCLVETLVQELKYPVATTSPAYGDAEMVGAVYIHICAFLRQILKASEPPVISLDKVASLLTQLLSKYAGPHQQRVIRASCGALVGLITTGMPQRREHDNLGRVTIGSSDVYLHHCYSLMNGYYVRLQTLLPTLLSQPSHMAYAQRFLFLLSEFLRLHRGWRNPIPSLLQLKTTTQPEMPNRLALHNGICENVFALIEEIEKKVPFVSQPPPLAAMVLRVLTSLCILDANTFLYRCERHLSAALASGADDRLHIQGLSMILDFLSEEEDRVEQSSSMALPPGAALCLPHTLPSSDNMKSTISAEDNSEQVISMKTTTAGGRQRKRSRERKTKNNKSRQRSGVLDHQSTNDIKVSSQSEKEMSMLNAPTSVPVWMEDQNSGMSPWVMAKFIDSVVRLASHSCTAIRQLCVHILALTAQGGLLPPMRYGYVLLLMTADLSSSVRSQAQRAILEHSGHWREDIKLNIVTKAALESLDYHERMRRAVPGRNLLSAAYHYEDREYHSIWENGFQLLQRKDRPQFLTHILRLFFDVDSSSTWCAHNQPLCWVEESSLKRAESPASLSSRPFEHRNPLTYLSHLALALSLLPIANVPSDSKHFVQMCLTGIDLEGQSAFDLIDGMLRNDSLSELTTCVLYNSFGVLLLSWMSQYMQFQADMISKTIMLGKPLLSRRTSTSGGKDGRESVADFIQLVSSQVQKLFPLAEYCYWHAVDTVSESAEERNIDAAMKALKHLQSELSSVVSSIDHLAMTTVHSKRKSQRSGGPTGKNRAVKPSRKRVKRSPSTVESTLESSCSSASSSSSSSRESSEDSEGTCSSSSSSESSSDSE